MCQLILSIFLAMLLCACTERAPRGTSGPTTAKAKPLIVVTIKPLELIVREVVGDTMEVRTLLPPGADPHDYEPTPSDIEAVSNAALFVMVGGHLDEWASELPAEQKFLAINNLGRSSFPSTYKPEPGQSDERAADLQFFEDGSADPHFWLNPISVQGMAGSLSWELSKEFPELEVALTERIKTFHEELSSYDQQAAEMLWKHRGKSVVQSHASLRYLLKAHELHSVGVIEEHTGIEPSAKKLASLISSAKTRKAKCVIVDAGHSDKAAKIIAGECDIPLVYMDPEATATTRSYESYRVWFIYNVRSLAGGLK